MKTFFGKVGAVLRRTWVWSLLLVLLLAVLVWFVGPLLAVWGARLITTALAARLSRGDEFEADAYASALLVKAGIGTGPQKSLFRKLEALTGARGAGVPAWLLSHPRSAERIRAIEEREARWARILRDED